MPITGEIFTLLQFIEISCMLWQTCRIRVVGYLAAPGSCVDLHLMAAPTTANAQPRVRATATTRVRGPSARVMPETTQANVRCDGRHARPTRISRLCTMVNVVSVCLFS